MLGIRVIQQFKLHGLPLCQLLLEVMINGFVSSIDTKKIIICLWLMLKRSVSAAEVAASLVLKEGFSKAELLATSMQSDLLTPQHKLTNDEKGAPNVNF